MFFTTEEHFFMALGTRQCRQIVLLRSSIAGKEDQRNTFIFVSARRGTRALPAERHSSRFSRAFYYTPTHIVSRKRSPTYKVGAYANQMRVWNVTDGRGASNFALILCPDKTANFIQISAEIKRSLLPRNLKNSGATCKRVLDMNLWPEVDETFSHEKAIYIGRKKVYRTFPHVSHFVRAKSFARLDYSELIDSKLIHPRPLSSPDSSLIR